MKRLVKLLALMLSLMMFASLMVSCDFGGNEENNGGDQSGENEGESGNESGNNNGGGSNNNTDDTSYTVTVVDEIGNPMSNVKVNLDGSGDNSKTGYTDKNGIATFKNMTAENFVVTVEKGFSDVQILQSTYQLSKDMNSLKVVVRNTANVVDIYGNVEDGMVANYVGVDTYSVVAEAGKSYYYVFHAAEKGVYNISFDSTDAEMTIGYYGNPMFVLAGHAGNGEYDGKSFELTIQDILTPYTIGLRCVNSSNVELKIEKIEEAPFDPQYAIATTVEATENFVKCDLPDGAVLTDLDITSSSLSVSLGNDGYYYTADGKLVYIRITSICDAAYLDVSLAYIAGYVNENVGQNVGGYVYDDDGNFVAKYSYNSLIESYMEYCDELGVYPMTKELADLMQIHGENAGWWKENTVNYLFTGVPVVKENAWLFLCCTAE